MEVQSLAQEPGQSAAEEMDTMAPADDDSILGEGSEDEDDVLLEEDDEFQTVEADTEALGGLLGVQVRDAREVETTVIGSCDAKVDLQRKQAELAKVGRQVALLKHRRPAFRRENGDDAEDRAANSVQMSDGGDSSGSLQADKNQAALEAAVQRQASLEKEVEEIKQRANRSGPLVDAVSQSRPENRWGRLQSHSFQGGSQDLDEQELDEQDDSPDENSHHSMQDSQVDAAVATANAVVEALKKGAEKPALPVKERGAPATLSDMEFLKRFKRKSAPKPPKDHGLPESCRGGSSSSTCVPAASAPPAKQHKGEHKKLVKVKQDAVKVKQELVKVKEEPRSPKQRRRTPAGSGENAPVQDEPLGDLLPPPFLDVNTLVPKSAQAHSQWKDANPSEWRALMSQGEIVSPHKNLLKVKPVGGAKRKTEASQSLDGPQKTRRGDDSNDQAYERRQDIWERGARASSVALKPKQQVDDEGKPLCKRDPSDQLQVKEEPGTADIRDDVHIAEGLRSPRWLWEALYPYQHTCVKWLWGLHAEKMGGILADEMGLGKTVQIAAYLAVLHHSGAGTAPISVPSRSVCEATTNSPFQRRRIVCETSDVELVMGSMRKESLEQKELLSILVRELAESTEHILSGQGADMPAKRPRHE